MTTGRGHSLHFAFLWSREGDRRRNGRNTTFRPKPTVIKPTSREMFLPFFIVFSWKWGIWMASEGKGTSVQDYDFTRAPDWVRYTSNSPSKIVTDCRIWFWGIAAGSERARSLMKQTCKTGIQSIEHQDASEGSTFSGCDCSHVTASNQSGRVATVSCSQSAASVQNNRKQFATKLLIRYSWLRLPTQIGCLLSRDYSRSQKKK